MGQTLAKSGFVNANVVKIISGPNWLLLTSSTLRVASPKRLARPPFVAAGQGHGSVPILRPLCRLTTQQPKSTNICSNCNQQLPREYLEEAVRGSPVCLGTFGLKGHGKTAFLSALTLSAEQLHKISPKAFSKPLDDNTRRKTSEWHIMEQEGNARMEATPPNTRPTPLLLLIKNFPPHHCHTLVTYDLAGEVLDKAGSDPEYVRALNKVNTIWFVISLYDMLNDNQTGLSMECIASRKSFAIRLKRSLHSVLSLTLQPLLKRVYHVRPNSKRGASRTTKE